MSLLIGDRALLDAFRAGSRWALAAVYAHYVDDVARLLSKGFTFTVGGRSCVFRGFQHRFDLEDMVQESFLRAFSDRARVSYDGVSPFRPYLFGIVRNVVIDGFRRTNRAFEAVALDPTLAAPSNATELVDGKLVSNRDPASDLENAELAAILEQFKQSLTPDEALVFRLRFQEGGSLALVVAQTGRSPAKVKTLEKRLRVRLMEKIWDSGYLDGFRVRSGNGWWARLLPALLEKKEAGA